MKKLFRLSWKPILGILLFTLIRAGKIVVFRRYAVEIADLDYILDPLLDWLGYVLIGASFLEFIGNKHLLRSLNGRKGDGEEG